MYLYTGLLAVFLLAVPAVASTADSDTTPSTVVARVAKAHIVVYYFHGSVRCPTCLKIERQARAAIERRFAVQVAAKRLVFHTVNYDKPENAHFLKDYKLPCPSLVVVRQKPESDRKWTLLDKTWELVGTPNEFNEYVEQETEKLAGPTK